MNKFFSAIASKVSKIVGKPITFLCALLFVIIWAITGPIFNYSSTWQLIINTSTTIITFLMLFIVQNSQNRDGLAIQAKLDEIINSMEGARNDLAHIEDKTEEEIQQIRC